MGDRSTIALLHHDGTVQSVYTHWSGYISGNGILLYQYYNSIDKIKELIELGDLYILGKNLAPPIGVQHTADKPFKETAVFYFRDCKAEKLIITEHKSLEDYINNGKFEGDNYIFNENKNTWFVIDRETKKLSKLTTLIMKDDYVDDSIKKEISNEKQAKKLDKTLSKKLLKHTKTNKI